MRLDRLSESLEDKDEFENSCDHCQDQVIAQGQIPPGFHEAHMQALRIAADAVYAHHREATGGELFNIYEAAFEKAMHEMGWIEGKYHEWTKTTVKEDLEDKDEFGDVAVLQRFERRGQRGTELIYIFSDNIKLFIRTNNNDLPAINLIALGYPDGTFEFARTGEIGAHYNAAWNADLENDPPIQPFGPEQAKWWHNMLKPAQWEPVKEDLDDKDEFKRDCTWEQCQFRTHDDVDEFHEAHTAATRAASRAINDAHYGDIFHAEMNKRGYFYRPGTTATVPDWVKESVKEDLEDKDEFATPNVHHHQTWDSTEDNQHWTVVMHNYFNGDQRIEGEYWVVGGMGKGMYLTVNFSDVDDRTAKRMLENASSDQIGDYAVDWDQAIRDAQRL